MSHFRIQSSAERQGHVEDVRPGCFTLTTGDVVVDADGGRSAATRFNAPPRFRRRLSGFHGVSGRCGRISARTRVYKVEDLFHSPEVVFLKFALMFCQSNAAA